MEESIWNSIVSNPPPVGEYILIKTKSGLVRIARRIVYANNTEQFTYSSTYYKNVLYWKPLPK